MSDSHDVIVIGSGAGGGTLVRHLAPSGKRILLLERGAWLTREPQNWLAEDPFVDGRYVSPDTCHYPDGSSFQPQVHDVVGGATKFYGAALDRLRQEDFGELRHHDGISPAWPISYDAIEPYYAQPSSSTTCITHASRTRPNLPRAPCTRSRRSPTNLGSNSSPKTSRRPGFTRSTRPAGSCSTRATGRSASAFAAITATAYPASCMPSLMPRSSPPERHPPHRCGDGARGVQRRRDGRDRGGGSARRRLPDLRG